MMMMLLLLQQAAAAAAVAFRKVPENEYLTHSRMCAVALPMTMSQEDIQH